MKIMLDAGHHGKWNRSPVLTSYYESEMNWKLCNYLADDLKKYGVLVGKTRSKIEEEKTVEKRGMFAEGYDLFISLHSNACDDPTVDRVTIITQLDGSCDKLGNALGAMISKMMGVSGYKIAKRSWSATVKDVEYYGVLRGAAKVGVPGMIIEHSFHTNLKSAQWLSVDDNLRILAKAEAESICAFYGISAPQKEPSGYIDGINVQRGSQQLIIYTPSWGSSTRTNKWGTALAVVDGKAYTRPVYGKGDMFIPKNGYVISAHDKAAEAIKGINPGDKINLKIEVKK